MLTTYPHVFQVQSVYFSPVVIVVSFSREIVENGVLQPNQTATYLDYFSTLASYIDLLAVDSTHTLQLNGQDFNKANWCAAHPDAFTHALIAKQVIEFIDSVYPDWGNSTSPNSVNVARGNTMG